MAKTISINDGLWLRLQGLKLRLGVRTFDDVIDLLATAQESELSDKDEPTIRSREVPYGKVIEEKPKSYVHSGPLPEQRLNSTNEDVNDKEAQEQ